jgi:Domain of unknown function (DUF6484)
MKPIREIAAAERDAFDEPRGEDCLLPLVEGRSMKSRAVESFAGTVIGELIAMKDDGRTPLVVFPGQIGVAAVAARSVVALHGAHVGKQVVLTFDGADGARPIILGVLRQGQDRDLDDGSAQVEVDADGERVTVSAKDRLVLRCGKASITLTRAGKILIDGAYVSSRSSGVNRIKGGSIQLN